MTQDKLATTAASASRVKSEPNKGPLCYGKPVTTMKGLSSFEHWHATTLWPDQHDTAIMFLREMRLRAVGKGLIFDAFKVEITDGKAHFSSHGLDGQPVDVREWCYRVKFIPPYPENAEPMYGLYIVYDPQDVDQRTTGVVPVYNFHDSDLVVQDL